MSVLRDAIFVLTFAAVASPALAEDTFPERTIDGWRVYGWSASCWMKREQQADGTQVMLSIGDDDHDLYIVARNEKWNSITSKKSYNVRVTFDSVDVQKNASPSFDDELRGVSLFVTGREESYLPNLRRSKQIELSIGGAVITRIPLTGSASALNYFEQCGLAIRALAAKNKQAYDRMVRDAMGGSGGDAPKPVAGDPFAGREDQAGQNAVASPRKANDPFAGKEDAPMTRAPSPAPAPSAPDGMR